MGAILCVEIGMAGIKSESVAALLRNQQVRFTGSVLRPRDDALIFNWLANQHKRSPGGGIRIRRGRDRPKLLLRLHVKASALDVAGLSL
jgi:hypothetical protein